MISERLFYFIHGAVTMFFLIAGLQRSFGHKVSRLQRLCGYILLYWAFLELKDLLFYTEPIVRNDYFSNLLVLFDMTAVPASICFVLEMIHVGWCTPRRMLLMVLPFIVAFVSYLIFASNLIFDALFVYAVLYSLLMVVYIYFAVKRYNKLVEENLSNTENVSVNWLSSVVIMLVVCFVLWIVSCYFTSWIVDGCYQLALLLMWVIMLYYSDRQKVVKMHFPVQIKATEDIEAQLGAKLELLMNKDEVWKNPHLSLADLALMIGTNRTYLSNYLNSTQNKTFYDYVNGYRIEAALRMMHGNECTNTMVEIAENSGFNSISTFRRVFSRVTGCSFGEYRQKMLEH